MFRNSDDPKIDWKKAKKPLSYACAGGATLMLLGILWGFSNQAPQPTVIPTVLSPAPQATAPQEISEGKPTTVPIPTQTPQISPSQTPEPEPTWAPFVDGHLNLLTLITWNVPYEGDDPPASLVNAPQLLNGTVKFSRSDMQLDFRLIDDARAMFEASNAAGNKMLYIMSAYRSSTYQEGLFQRKLRQSSGYAAAPYQKPVSVLPGGVSEHATGLAFDVVSVAYTSLQQGFAQTQEGRWLAEHCWEYGFIIRYPKGKEHLTGIIFEPWHLRYVGKEAAKEIYDNGWCLEEWHGYEPTDEKSWLIDLHIPTPTKTPGNWVTVAPSQTPLPTVTEGTGTPTPAPDTTGPDPLDITATPPPVDQITVFPGPSETPGAQTTTPVPDGDLTPPPDITLPPDTEPSPTPTTPTDGLPTIPPFNVVTDNIMVSQ